VKKAILFGGLAVIALLPAVIGLTSNPSLSARVPLQPAQVQVVDESPTGARTVRATPSASPTHRASSTPGATRSDDHGGDRKGDDSGSGHGRGRGRGGDD
jgi:hypothetical protein